MTQLLSAILLVFHLFLPLPISSENIIVNGSRGFSWLWHCRHTFSEPFLPEESLIYWQGQKEVISVVHVYIKGKEEFEHQSQLFKNRTKIFPDQLPVGNFSLVIKPLMLKDDQTSFNVIFISGSMQHEKLCHVTLHVSAPFHEPEIKINQNEKTATCSTMGGYPKPEVIWSSRDHPEGHERTLEEVQTTVTSEEDGTYSISSTANITGLFKVTCTIYNPTSNQTLSTTKYMTPSKTPGAPPAPFHEPEIKINQNKKTATCSTMGGYPKPEVIWSSRDHPEGHEHTLEEVQTTVTSEEDGTYSISSTANITGLFKVTCTIYNPTSNQTLSTTKYMTPSKTPGAPPAPFHEPEIKINQNKKTATCSTMGGYPKPEVIWSSRDHPEGHEHTLEEVQTTVTSEEDGTYSISSTANITGLYKVTCTIYNPTSNQTLSTTKYMTPSKTPGAPPVAAAVSSALFIVALIILYCRYRRGNQTQPGTRGLEPNPVQNSAKVGYTLDP